MRILLFSSFACWWKDLNPEPVLEPDPHASKLRIRMRIQEAQKHTDPEHWFLQFFVSKLTKNLTQSFSLLLWNYLPVLILKILPVNCFKDPKVATFTLKMLTGSRLWFCKIIPEAACNKLILAHFPCSQWYRYRPITEKVIMRWVSVSILNINTYLV